MSEFLATCDRLYRTWSDDRLDADAWGRQILSTKVSFEHAPEPYLAFDGADVTSSASQLVFLTTNPGSPKDFQTREKAGGYPSYHDLQSGLVEVPYGREIEKIGPGAKRRIERMRDIARCLGTCGFIQCEVVPFHSGSLPHKHRLAKWLSEEGKESPLATYHSHLRAFLEDKHVIALDASNSPSAGGWQGWLRLKADIFGFDEETATMICLKQSEAKRASTCLFRQSQGVSIRAYYLTQGGNDFRNHTSEEWCEALKTL